MSKMSGKHLYSNPQLVSRGTPKEGMMYVQILYEMSVIQLITSHLVYSKFCPGWSTLILSTS